MPYYLAGLVKRQNYCNDGYYDNSCYYYSPWWVYGRWILFGAIIVAAFLLFCIFSARRRRRNGMQPFRGTGWAAPPAYGAGGYPVQQPGGGYYGGGPQQGQGNWTGPPPPQYGAPDGSHYGKPAGGPGYGQQSGSVELQSPAHAYQRDAPAGDHVYQPPPGPPPGKGDGIVR